MDFVLKLILILRLKTLKGKEVDIGSIASGGRYDKLISRFKGADFPGTGMSIGVDRLLYVLSQINSIKTKNNKPVLICILDSKYLKKILWNFRISKRKWNKFRIIFRFIKKFKKTINLCR